MKYRSTATLLAILVTLAAESQTLGQSTAQNNRLLRRLEQLEKAHEAASEVADVQKRGKAMVQVATQFAKSGQQERAIQIAKAIRDRNSKHAALAAVEKIGLLASLSQSEEPTSIALKHLIYGRVRPAVMMIDQVSRQREKDFILLNVVSAMTTNRLLSANLIRANRSQRNVRFEPDVLLGKNRTYTAEAMSRAAGYAAQIQNRQHSQFALTLVALAHVDANQTTEARAVISRITDRSLRDTALLHLSSKLATGKMLDGEEGWLRLSTAEAASLPTLKSIKLLSTAKTRSQ